jgi:hypothetical protein
MNAVVALRFADGVAGGVEHLEAPARQQDDRRGTHLGRLPRSVPRENGIGRVLRERQAIGRVRNANAAARGVVEEELAARCTEQRGPGQHAVLPGWSRIGLEDDARLRAELAGGPIERAAVQRARAEDDVAAVLRADGEEQRLVSSLECGRLAVLGLVVVEDERRDALHLFDGELAEWADPGRREVHVAFAGCAGRGARAEGQDQEHALHFSVPGSKAKEVVMPTLMMRPPAV